MAEATQVPRLSEFRKQLHRWRQKGPDFDAADGLYGPLPDGIYQSDGGRWYAIRRKGRWYGGDEGRYDPEIIADKGPWHLMVRADGSDTPAPGKGK